MKIRTMILSISIIFLFSTTWLKADYLLDSYNYCIKSYHLSNNKFIWVVSKDNSVYSTNHTQQVKHIFPNYTYIKSSDTCIPNDLVDTNSTAFKLGLSLGNYNFLMALLGLLIGFGILFSFFNIFSRR